MHITSLIIADSRPLIDLALADELDTLLTLAPKMQVLIPDMVRHDLMSRIEQFGVPDALEWIRVNEGEGVWVQSTQEMEEFIVLGCPAGKGRTRTRNELAAAELLGREQLRQVEAIILLLDDASIGHAPFLKALPDNVVLLSTSGYLQKLKSRRMRPVVGALLQRFMARGRSHA